MVNWTVTSLILVAVAMSGALVEGWLSRGLVEARATILENHHKGRGGYLLVSFTGPSEENIRARADVYGWPSATDPGDTIMVRYSPGDPAGTVILKPSVPDIAALMLIGAGAVVNLLITCGVWSTWFVRRPRRNTAAPGGP